MSSHIVVSSTRIFVNLLIIISHTRHLLCTQKLLERDNRKKKREVTRKKEEEESILNVIKSRGVRLGTSHTKGSATITLQDLEAHHPVAQVKHHHQPLLVQYKTKTFPASYYVCCYCSPS